jgi:hypothetical protein
MSDLPGSLPKYILRPPVTRHRVAPERENGLVSIILPALDAELAVGIGNGWAAIGGDCERRRGDQRQETDEGSPFHARCSRQRANTELSYWIAGERQPRMRIEPA